MDAQFLPHENFQFLLEVLQQSGYRCIGPQVRDGAIVYDDLTEAKQLPWGVRDSQQPGEYTLKTTAEKKAFAWANGPQGIKPHLFKARETIWRVIRNDVGKLEFKPEQAEEQPIAYIGGRSCDLMAMSIQDKVFVEGPHQDPRYRYRREQLFVVAVNCSYASSSCFCVSAGTGPEVQSSYDLLLTEIDKGFTVKSGSERGQNILLKLILSKASPLQQEQAADQPKQAASMQTKRIPLDNKKGLRDLLFSNLNHPRWDDVAERCLSCGNCTLVCPTCFCHSEVEKPSLDGSGSEHQREWDSCFSEGHSYLGGEPIREDTRKRYRQWLTHKVGSWFDQFDVSGCVGCGRCVTWCPVGIDITEELAAISGESNIKKVKDD
ncbi:4Fe-4S dicluster domain-containing protein [Legionella israelensis]|uniref:Hydrogenase subunit n=1 Tax=Legionella israelensis TaxID=454 RepID=A0A0W0V2I9_9GAMM|nr:4Fe-4S dicluster domain-containing protein [Legionella israelensis]KTD14109.1 hydrogenase subunit [Legionella israelensis]QBS10326.1 sulfite reductase subunit A [Legionella israelensis]SCY34564.1 4Fe-4S dicluster domain-containing protein [Legionella israelensis DSM 19235]STX59927.1 hydrogenase subunit [Legionella israelensis]